MMKKQNRVFISLLLCVILTGCLLTGCQTAEPTVSDETTVENDNSDTGDNREDTNECLGDVYISASYSCGTYSGLNRDSYNFISSQETSLLFRYDLDKGEWESESKTLVLGENVYAASQARTLTCESISNDTSVMASYRVLDAYCETLGEQRVDFYYRQGTNELVRFFVSGDNSQWITGDLTAEEAKEKADDLLASLYDKETIDKYTYDTTTYSENSNCYNVKYTRYVYGYRTEDQIIISYTMAGEVKSINALCMGYADVIESQVDAEKLLQAETNLQNCLEENMEIDIGQLMLDADGQCYMLGGTYLEKK